MILLKYGGSWSLAFILQLALLALIWRRTCGNTRRVALSIWALFFIAYCVVPVDFLFSLTFPVAAYRAIVLPALVWQFAVGFAAVGLLLGLAWTSMRHRRGPQSVLDRLLGSAGLRRTLWALFFAGAIFAVVGLHNALSPPTVVRHVIPVRGLKAQVTVLHVTDTHAGYFCGADELGQVVELARRLQPDLVFLTGDQLHGAHAPFADLLRRGLTGLHPKYGVFQVAGNHDHRTGVKLLYDALSPLGVVALHNRHVVVQTAAGPLVIAGVDDTYYGGDLRAALTGRPAGVPVLLLSHRPDVLTAAAAAGVDVVFAGHTHGGQLCLPGVCLSDFEGPWRRGLYREGDTVMNISSGVGTTGLPLRIFSPPDVGWIILDPGDGDVADRKSGDGDVADRKSGEQEFADRKSGEQEFAP